MRLILLICLTISTICKAYTQDIAGYDQYRDYNKHIYIDNLLQEYFPNNLHDYYSSLGDKNFINKSQEYDTISKKHNIYIFSKKAKNGYLHINSSVMNYLNKSKEPILKVIYIVDNKTISDNDFVRLLTMRKMNIKTINYLISEKNIEVKIGSNKMK